ncbi:MAG: cell division protein FtsW, partial [Parcubacteria group bacterium Athens0416_74]
MKRGAHIDRPLALIIAILVVGGCMIFASAAFGLLARGATHMSSVVFSHLVLGVGLGLVALVIGTTLDYRIWKKYAPHLFVLALVATALVFVPQIGFSHGGGTRWLHIAGISLQPSEGLKLAAVIAAAAYFSLIKTKVSTFTYGFGGFLAILSLPVLLLLLQPDTGTLGIIAISVTAVFFAAGASWKQIGATILIG